MLSQQASQTGQTKGWAGLTTHPTHLALLLHHWPQGWVPLVLIMMEMQDTEWELLSLGTAPVERTLCSLPHYTHTRDNL